MIKSQLILRSIAHRITAVSVIILFLGFSASNATENICPETLTVDIKDSSSLKASSQDKFGTIARNLDVRSRIMNQYADWKGVRYRFGGSTKKGIDCSAFVQRTFREQFGLNLPRSTYEQQDIGRSISRNKLRTGDLVLFCIGSTGRHIGIYIDNGQFVHASASKGVTISSLHKPYWNKRYNKARRVLIYS